jgi:L-methionine (R)-S-oxide reductase
MSEIVPVRGVSHETLLVQLDALLQDGDDPVTLMANTASLLYWSLVDVNWVGFYLLRDDELRLGPFHGMPACTRIGMGQGVCGTGARDARQLNIPDVDVFPGHIACDAVSRSELVTPLIAHGDVRGVLDIDSPLPARFTAADEHLALRAAALVAARM